MMLSKLNPIPLISRHRYLFTFFVAVAIAWRVFNGAVGQSVVGSRSVKVYERTGAADVVFSDRAGSSLRIEHQVSDSGELVDVVVLWGPKSEWALCLVCSTYDRPGWVGYDFTIQRRLEPDRIGEKLATSRAWQQYPTTVKCTANGDQFPCPCKTHTRSGRVAEFDAIFDQ